MKDKFIQFLGLTKRAGKLLEGYNKCEDALKKNKIFLVILSLDVSENTLEKFLKHSNRCGVSIIQKYSKEELGSALGLEEIKILGVSDKKMSEKLISLHEEIEKL